MTDAVTLFDDYIRVELRHILNISPGIRFRPALFLQPAAQLIDAAFIVAFSILLQHREDNRVANIFLVKRIGGIEHVVFTLVAGGIEQHILRSVERNRIGQAILAGKLTEMVALWLSHHNEATSLVEFQQLTLIRAYVLVLHHSHLGFFQRGDIGQEGLQSFFNLSLYAGGDEYRGIGCHRAIVGLI